MAERIPDRPCRACVATIEQRRGPIDAHANEAQQTERRRLWHAQHLIHIFRDIHGRDSRSVKEFEDWARIRRQTQSQEAG